MIAASNTNATIVSRIVKKANGVRGSPRSMPRAAFLCAPALVRPRERRIMSDVFSKERLCESDCSSRASST
ncbi:hypothetical protein D8O27_29945 [Burkholderia mallei]|uniref:Uncharacterized protein n=2 Tax=pseudomallei group TaxID=111527 RepID=A0AAX1X7X1_BURML|nr:hypothetical protein BURPS668_2605 [Burkholderia pseudomallei 668]ARK50304.1 hypothetical protein BOC35_30235 [Burkholderia pseudomallei]EXJ01057.1 hypothetical protein T210_0118025 [Burkholderia pseudomallei MSHR6137]PNW97809.1 hypothetical protein CF649_27635 [Burkholderia sp. 136(2017)]PNX11801.1 hypothetical protein CF650_28935 [Burkholderia sp. 129]PNX26219.1 hypothetical protein CF647_27270 [Burkholderia sp. 117]PNX34709.1 hypothetical protein CF648_27640 [Burkholderia sp. 137]RKN90